MFNFATKKVADHPVKKIKMANVTNRVYVIIRVEENMIGN